MRLTPFSPDSAVFTYRIGNGLYIPLTSFCNTRTLPELRGPSFQLSPHITEALLNVRAAEIHDVDTITMNRSWMHQNKYYLPPRHKDEYKKYSLYHKNLNGIDNINIDSDSFDDGLFPSISSLLHQVETQITNDTTIESVIFGGEGESTLRLPAILRISKSIRKMQTNVGSVRLITNGLVDTVSSTTELESCLASLQLCGITHISVTLPSHCPLQYNDIMEPITPLSQENQPSFLQRVCNYIQEAIRVGLEVEVTGIDRPDIIKTRVETLATKLGVTTTFRWRSYHP